MPSLAPINFETWQKSSFVSMAQDKAVKEQFISQELPSHLKALLPCKFKAASKHQKQGTFLSFVPWIIFV